MRSLTHALIALVAVLTLGSAVGCNRRPPQMPAPAQLMTTATNDVNAAAAKALGILNSAAAVLDEGSLIEAELGPALPANVHADLKAQFLRAAQAGKKAVDAIEEGAIKDWPTLRSKIQPVLDVVQPLANAINGSSGAVRERLASIGRLLLNLVSQALSVALAPRIGAA